jgi:hypothetical protein
MRFFSRVLVKALLALLAVFISSPASDAQQEHSHLAPEKLGTVSFAISCRPEVHAKFERAVALLHSFAYADAEKAFRGVAERDAKCAMAHWGVAMTYFHELWEPPLSAGAISNGQREIQRAQQLGAGTERERKFINALSLIYQDGAVGYRPRATNYERAMKELASENQHDAETQVFYALALLANTSPADKTHAKQKEAADLLEPLFRSYPQHPGIPHYLIHAYDNAELAQRGRAAAEAYAQIAASTPHALHMPSHIFTRLGLWDESIASNTAARDAAHQQGDTGEELHAMDYLVYAFLQNGRDADAAQIVEQVRNMAELNTEDFKVAYASTAMPIRYAVERGRWADAAAMAVPAGAPPYVAAIAVWARGLGMARSGHATEARAETGRLRELEKKLRASGSEYWAGQVDILTREILAWATQADGKSQETAAMLREAADLEDATEKLPVTPGPILPAREQLGYLLLEQHQSDAALKEFKIVLANSPGRRGALQGAARAAELSSGK